MVAPHLTSQQHPQPPSPSRKSKHLCKQALREMRIPEQGSFCQRAFLSSDTLVTQELAAGVTCSLLGGRKKALVPLSFAALGS